jgi:hypothetical protein
LLVPPAEPGLRAVTPCQANSSKSSCRPSIDKFDLLCRCSQCTRSKKPTERNLRPDEAATRARTICIQVSSRTADARRSI